MNHRRLVFLGESAVNTAMTPTHGRAPRGERVHDSVPRSYGEQTSVIGALSFGRGLLAVMTLTGAVDTLAFDAYLARVLAPRLRKGEVVVLDNLNVHKASQVEQVAEARGARVLWLAPYSPDFGPIEQCWSKIKTLLRAAKARTREDWRRRWHTPSSQSRSQTSAAGSSTAATGSHPHEHRCMR